MGELQFCYDALELLRYIQSEQNARKSPSLPDNRILLLPAGVEEVRRVARLSFQQRYQVAGQRGQFPSFATEDEAAAYVAARPGRQLYLYSFADVGDDPLLEDLLYPDGYEETPLDPIPGSYFDEREMAARSVRNRLQEQDERDRRQREAQEQEEQERREEQGEVLLPREGLRVGDMEREAILVNGLPLMLRERFIEPEDFERMMEREDEELRVREEEERNEPEIRRDGEVEIGDILAVEVRQGEWRCGSKDDFYRRRQDDLRYPSPYPINLAPSEYCSVADLNALRVRGREVHDPSEWGLGSTEDVHGEQVLFFPETGTPSCSSGGDNRLNDPCRPDLVEEVAARRPRRYLAMSEPITNHEIEYRFDRPSQQLRCRDLDDMFAVEEDCTEEMREELGWNPVAEDSDIIDRRLTLRGSIECATKEQWHFSRATGQPIPWVECNEDQRNYLSQLPEHRGESFRNMESGRYADEIEAEDAAREGNGDDQIDGRFDVDENIEDDERDE